MSTPRKSSGGGKKGRQPATPAKRATPTTLSRGAAGGAADAAGADFQAEVAAWFAVRILAETHASPLLDLPADSTLQSVACQVASPIDDVHVAVSTGGRVMVQAKRSLSMSAKPSSELASVVRQFVRAERHPTSSELD